MATAKIVLDKRRKDNQLIDLEKGTDFNKYPLRIRIFKDTDFKEITYPYKFTITEWIENENRVDKSYPNSNRINSSIQERYSIVTTILSDHQRAIDQMDLEQMKIFVVTHLDKKLNERSGGEVQGYIDNSRPQAERELYLAKFGKVIIERTRSKKKNGTAKWYEDGIAAIKNFNGRKDILIADITITFLEDFEAHHLSIGNTLNGIAPYLRAVRSITNKAVKELLKNKRFDCYPWAGGYVVKTEDTKPRPIRIEVVDKIRKLKYEKKSPEWNAQNYLLFMFNNRGMNFIDVAKFTRNKIEEVKFTGGKLIEGRLTYQRSKTDVSATMKLTSESIKILNDYDVFGKGEREFVFPIGYEETKTGRETYSQKRKRLNKTMTKLAADAGHPEVKITTYTLRYLFATELRRQGFGLDVVQEALAQKDSRSAQIYTENYEESVLDRVTEMIITKKVKRLTKADKNNGDKRVSVYAAPKQKKHSTID